MVAGDKCSPGYFCLEGSSTEDPCPPGYYLPSAGAKNITYCIDCTTGSYCNRSGLASPEGLCTQGFYCPAGQTVPNPNSYPCPYGYYCVEGSSMPQLCDSGTYQDEMYAYTCKECPAGFYCDNAVEPVVNYTMYECIEGGFSLSAKETLNINNKMVL